MAERFSRPGHGNLGQALHLDDCLSESRWRRAGILFAGDVRYGLRHSAGTVPADPFVSIRPFVLMRARKPTGRVPSLSRRNIRAREPPYRRTINSRRWTRRVAAFQNNRCCPTRTGCSLRSYNGMVESICDPFSVETGWWSSQEIPQCQRVRPTLSTGPRAGRETFRPPRRTAQRRHSFGRNHPARL